MSERVEKGVLIRERFPIWYGGGRGLPLAAGPVGNDGRAGWRYVAARYGRFLIPPYRPTA